MERHLQLQREVTDERRAAGDEHFVCPGMVVGQAVLTDSSPMWCACSCCHANDVENTPCPLVITRQEVYDGAGMSFSQVPAAAGDSSW
jgi:hypothetical protein